MLLEGAGRDGTGPRVGEDFMFNPSAVLGRIYCMICSRRVSVNILAIIVAPLSFGCSPSVVTQP